MFLFSFLCVLTLVLFINGDSSIQSAEKLLIIARENVLNGPAESEIPFVTISYAQTIDGSIAPLDRTRLDISSKCSFRLLHSLRACHDAVLIGINTLICDDPQLNVREPLPSISLPSIQPRSIIIDSKLRFTNIHMNMRLQNPLVITSVTPNTDRWVKAQSLLAEHGGQLVYCPCTIDGRCSLLDAFKILKLQCGIKSILVEGGAEVIQGVLEQKLVHQFVVTLRACLFGGYRSLTRQLTKPYPLVDSHLALVDGDIILQGCVDYSDFDSLDACEILAPEEPQDRVDVVSVVVPIDPFAADNQAIAAEGDCTTVSDPNQILRKRRQRPISFILTDSNDDVQ